MGLHLTVDLPKARFVVVHYHIFKNGGSTIESILEREFPGRFATLHGVSADGTLGDEDLVSFLADYPNIAAVSSHHLRYPLPELRDTGLFDWCFLRHPFVRLQSMYSYLRKIGAAEPLSQLAANQNVREFLRYLIDYFPHLASNVQVGQLANSGRFTRLVGRDDVQRAAEVVRRMAIPGIVEAFDESLVSAEYVLQPAFPRIRLHYSQKNASQSGAAVNGLDGQPWNEVWGEDVYCDLLRLNELDLELYQAAEDEIQRRFTMVPRAGEKLADLRSRCGEVQRAEAGGTA